MNCALPAVRPVQPARRRGVALVITLIMLSVVTITAVAFLAISRRERLAIGAFGEQIDARYLADTALNRAKGDLLGRMFATSNRLAYGFAVSTNYQNPQFKLGDDYYYRPKGNLGNLTNVAYAFRSNSPAFDFDLTDLKDRQTYAGLLGNLFYDPRPPVFVRTKLNPADPWDFRYYLDLNRNGRPDTNGLLAVTGPDGTTNSFGFSEFFVGDPEWIGVLEYPDVPHSGTNRFIGRFCYLILPTGRSLDANHLGNDAKTPNITPDLPGPTVVLRSGYLRNQGIGSWELNAAGFFRALNTNVWQVRSPQDFQYVVTPTVENQGLAFSDAERLLRFRRNGVRPDNARQFFQYEQGLTGSTVGDRLESDLMDTYANGPVLQTFAQVTSPPLQAGSDNDKANQPWDGSDDRRRFTEISQFFDPLLGITNRFNGVDLRIQNVDQRRREHTNSTYNAYTFYRGIGQLGTDSPDARFESGFHPAYGQVNFDGRAVDPQPTYFRRAKLNLNYAHDPNGDRPENASLAGLKPWTPLNWFTNAADRLLLSEFTNGLPIIRSREIQRSIDREATKFSPYGFPVYGALTLSNNVQTDYRYDSQVHRLLQVAANIYDYANAPASHDLKRAAGTGTNGFRLVAPTIYRPRFYVDQRTPSVLRIADYELFEDVTRLPQQRWLSPDEALRQVGLNNLGLAGTVKTTTDLNVFGIPWVVGARKGLPSFNEGFWQSAVRVTRRLLLRKLSPNVTLSGGQSVFSGSSPIETRAQYRITITNTMGVEAWNSYGFDFPVPVTVTVRHTNRWVLYSENANRLTPVLTPVTTAMNATHTIAAGKWRAGEYVGTRTNLLADFIYDPAQRRVYPLTATNFGWVDVSVATPNLTLAVTNSLVFTIETTGNPRRLLDVVSMQSVTYETNIFRMLGVADAAGGIQVASTRSATSRPGGEMAQFWFTNRMNTAGTRGISNQFLASLGQIDVGPLWRDVNGSGVRLTDRQFAIDGLNYFLYRTNRAGLTAAQIDAIRRQFGGTNVQVGFNPSPMMVFTERRQANDPLVHYVKDDLLPGYTAVALAAPGYPGAYAGEVERNHTRMLDGVGVQGQVWGQIWRPVNLTDPNTRWTNAALQSVGIRREDGWPAGITTNFWTDHIQSYQPSAPLGPRRYQHAKAPWGQPLQLGGTAPDPADPAPTNLGLKDPQIYSADNWRFLAQLTNTPATLTNLAYPNIGWLGRVHRGTPWQTAYLKSAVMPLTHQNGLQNAPWMASFFGEFKDWPSWAGSMATHPVHDWKLLDLFTTALNDNAAKGLLAPNQTNLAAWAAVLSGVPVLDNRPPLSANDPQSLILRPDSPEVAQIIGGYTNRSTGFVVPGLMTLLQSTNVLGLGFPSIPIAPGGVFTNLGSLLSVPTLSDQAPFLQLDVNARNVTDELVERLPQQIASLLRADEPLVTVYAFGQSLKPAANSFALSPGPFYGMVTNYVVTGEFATKSLLRFEGPINSLSTKVEDYRILYQNP